MEDPCDQAWEDIKRAFGLEKFPLSPQVQKNGGVLPASTISYLIQENLLEGALDYLQAEVEERLRVDIVPSFWKHFTIGESCNKPESDRENEAASRFQSAVNDLYINCVGLLPMVVKMDKLAADCNVSVNKFGQTSYRGLFYIFLRGTLHSQLPKSDFRSPILAFYSRAFHVFHFRREGSSSNLNGSMDSEQDTGDDSLNMECEGCKREPCACTSIIAAFHDVNRKLLELKLLERLTSEVVTSVVKGRIAKYVNDSCTGSFTASYLNSLSDWLDAVVMSWIRLIYSAESSGIVCNDEFNAILKSFRQRLAHLLYETYTHARIDQLFNIIIEFPESQPALEDLKECLEKTDLRPELTKSLKKVLEKKLLHLGVNTSDILTAYIASIRALQVLDPSGVLLEIVCEPVRKYLRTRDDTVRCIVQSLIDDNSSELTDELMKSEGLCLDDSFMADDLANDTEELEANWDTWQPDPVDADPSSKLRSSRNSKRSSDIISMLVNIYGSKELFVNEYRSLLSNRLLSQFSYETEREIRNLELLKLRFGEAPLHQCEVMLKDISDSKRINILLHNENSDDTTASIKFKDWPVNAIVLSAQFWPQFKAENLVLPAEVEHSLQAYTKAFEAIKGNRTLVWKHHLGTADLDLEIGDGKKISLNGVSPIHAAIIYQFQVKAEWSLEDLAKELGISVSTVRRRINFWLTQGLIRETMVDYYKLAEEGPVRRMSGIGNHGEANDEEEAESVTRTSRDQRAEELQVFWTYIVNMLINLESLPLDRIFTMLKMFAMQGPSAVECNIDELRSFLDEKVRTHELHFSGGQYKLPKT